MIKQSLAYALAFITGVIVAGVLGSVVQTQFNLLAMQTIGPPIDWSTRVEVTGYDLVNFSPLLMGIMAATFLIALPISHLFSRFQKRQFIAWCAVGAGVGFWAALQLIDNLAPMPTLIAATRTTTGTLFMVLSACAAGAVYAWLSRALRRRFRGSVPTEEAKS
ncbi:hypothetical protein [Aliidiomarina sanyensis]|uniref:Uncharacterized protein n=1 Tax=Aliidiomarina sanyensis TaxID=1249555 RepID=A0A432WAL7_9GAMM|nr:hypothetical protein [Aliidiomarina sanyensis]RUO27461.1 hypothetical protein CWE11_11640 [Aliidiomarina sanyensis]